MPESQYIVHQPFLYDIGPIKGIGGFGLAMLMCFVTGQILLTRELIRRGYDPAPVGDLVFAAVVGGLLGAKIYYAILVQDAGALFDRAGFVFWGGLIGGIIGTSLVVRFKKLRWSTIADASAMSLAAAYSVGRPGCWAVGDDYGRPSNLPWAVAFPNGLPPTDVPVHPTQIYEALFLGWLAWLLIREQRRGVADRRILGHYMILAGGFRFVVEFIRVNEPVFLGFTVAQILAFILSATGVVLLSRASSPRARQSRRAPS